MDIHETAVEQEIVAEPEMAEEYEEEAEQEAEAKDEPDEEEYEETITLSATDVYALQDTLEDIRFQILNIQRNACHNWLESQAMLQDILSRLPPASGGISTNSRGFFSTTSVTF